MKIIKLKPCPFCGGTDLIFSPAEDFDHGDVADIECADCLVSMIVVGDGGYKYDKRLGAGKLKESLQKQADKLNKSIIKNWNKRVK